MNSGFICGVIFLYFYYSDQNSFQTSTGKHANVRFDGTVTWLCDVLVRSLCPVDLSYFPFDAQMCTLKFGSSTSLDESLHFHMSQTPPGSIPGVTRDRIDTTLAGEWVLVENKVRLLLSFLFLFLSLKSLLIDILSIFFL